MDGRVRIDRRDTPCGVAAARNLGLHLAHGPWVAFLDDDDVWSPHKLGKQLSAADATGAVFAYSPAVLVDVNLRPLRRLPLPDAKTIGRTLLERNVVPAGASNVVARTAVLRELGGFAEAFSHLDDWDLWIRLAAAGPATATATGDPLVAYRLHRENRFLHDPQTLLDEFEMLRRRHADAARKQGTAFDAIDYYRWVAHGLRRAGRRREAARTYAAAARRGRDPGALARALGALVSPAPRSGNSGELAGAEWLAAYR